MARVTLGDRLEVLASSPHLPVGKREFAASLLVHYQKRQSLTSGRREWVDRLEAIVEETKTRDPSEYQALVADIEDVMSRTEETSWNRGFLESVRNQARATGSRLSARQQEIFEKIKAENTPEIAMRHSERLARWTQEYRAHHLETAAVLANYYLRTGYWTQMGRSIIDDAEYVPPMDKFEKMRGNKFAAKVLDAWNADPKYPVGTSVHVRPGKTSHLKKGGMVLSTTEPIVSAAAGCKRYKVLPYDSTLPVMVEERDVKLFRRTKKK